MENILIGVAIVIAVLILLWIVIGKVQKADERDEALIKYVLLFDTKTKKFSEQRNDEFEEEEDVVIIAINDHSLVKSFLRFCNAESYYPSTIYQARKVFDIYSKSRTPDNTENSIKSSVKW